MHAARVRDVLAGHRDHEVRERDVTVPQLVAPMTVGAHTDARQRVTGPPAHGHPLDDVRSRGDHVDVGTPGTRDGAAHHGAGGIAGAEEDDARHSGEVAVARLRQAATRG